MDSWLLRWDTARESAPRIVGPTAPGGLDRETGPSRSGHPEPHGWVASEIGEGAHSSPIHVETVSESGRWATALDGYVFGLATAPGGAARLADRLEVDGPNALDRLRGGFSVAHWSEARRTLLLARDALGIGAQFYSWNDGVLVASPSMALLRATPGVDTGINAQLVTEMLLDRFHSGQASETYFNGIQRLPPAHFIEVRDGRLTLRRYWDPIPGEFEWASDAELSRFTEMIEASVERCLEAGADSLALSGGFDSVGLAAVANHLRGERPPLHALSLHMRDTATDEVETQRAVAQALDMPQTLLTLDECLEANPLWRGVRTLSASSPTPLQSMWQPAYVTLLEAGQKAGLCRLMLGSGGDETLSVDTTYGADCLARGELGAFWRYFRALQKTTSEPAWRVARQVLWTGGARPWLIRFAEEDSAGRLPFVRRRYRAAQLRRWMRTCPWLEPELMGRVSERERESRAGVDPSAGHYTRLARELLQHPVQLLARDQASTWTHRLGYLQFLPFWDRDLVALLIRVHPEKLFEGGRFKAPIRRLVAERLPTVEMRRRKVDYRLGSIDVLRGTAAGMRHELEGSLELTRLGIARESEIRRFLERFLQGSDGRWGAAWGLVSTELWLRAQSDTGLAIEPVSVVDF